MLLHRHRHSSHSSHSSSITSKEVDTDTTIITTTMEDLLEDEEVADDVDHLLVEVEVIEEEDDVEAAFTMTIIDFFIVLNKSKI